MEQAKKAKTFPQNAEVIHNELQNMTKKLRTFLSGIRKIVDNFYQSCKRNQSSTGRCFQNLTFYCSIRCNLSK